MTKDFVQELEGGKHLLIDGCVLLHAYIPENDAVNVIAAKALRCTTKTSIAIYAYTAIYGLRKSVVILIVIIAPIGQINLYQMKTSAGSYEMQKNKFCSRNRATVNKRRLSERLFAPSSLQVVRSCGR